VSINKYQKIALLLGAGVLLIVFGKSLAKIGFGAMAFMGKGVIIIAATVLVYFMLKKPKKNQ
jgi:hypothetical protein